MLSWTKMFWSWGCSEIRFMLVTIASLFKKRLVIAEAPDRLKCRANVFFCWILIPNVLWEVQFGTRFLWLLKLRAVIQRIVRSWRVWSLSEHDFNLNRLWRWASHCLFARFIEQSWNFILLKWIWTQSSFVWYWYSQWIIVYGDLLFRGDFHGCHEWCGGEAGCLCHVDPTTWSAFRDLPSSEYVFSMDYASLPALRVNFRGATEDVNFRRMSRHETFSSLIRHNFPVLRSKTCCRSIANKFFPSEPFLFSMEGCKQSVVAGNFDPHRTYFLGVQG